MKIIIEEPQDGEEEQVIVKCHRIAPKDVFYIEAVDNKTFLYYERDHREFKQDKVAHPVHVRAA